MKPQRSNIYILGDNQYAIINRKFYRLEELDDDEIAESYNGGDAIPLVQGVTFSSPDV